jgi:hypothetical protein
MPITNKCESFRSKAPAEVKAAKKIARNSWRYTRADGAECVRLHQTDVTVTLKGQTTFNSGGWRTVTTKDRMNRSPSSFRVYSDKGQWFVRDYNTGQIAPYFDGITLPRDFKQSKKSAGKMARERVLLAQINKFCDKMKKLPALPMPAGGDCFFCSMFTQQKPGQKLDNVDHIESHVREGYIHGSLIVNALRWSGMGEMGIALYLSPRSWQGRDKAYTVGKVRRYLKAQLGVGSL